MKKSLQIGAIALCFFAVTACQNDIDTASSQNQPPKQEVKLEKIKLSGKNLETNKKISNKILSKDKNLVFVWQPSCPPCKEEAAAIEKIYKDFKDINMIGLGVAENEEDVSAALKEWKISFPNYYLSVDKVASISKNITSTPTILILDKEGNEIQEKIVGSSSNGDDVDKLAQELSEKIKAIQNE